MFPDSWQQQYDRFFSEPGAGWSHAQLVEVAAVALERGEETSLRARLQQFAPGYHETVTSCWLELLRQALQARLNAEDLAHRLGFSQLPFGFYSPQLLGSSQAVQTHLPPDLKPVELPVRLSRGHAATLVAFQSRRLPKQAWTHACHLRVAAGIYLLLGEGGMHVMSVGIQRLNEVHGVPLTPTGGYHETLTRLWFHLVARAVRNTGLAQQADSDERMQTVLNMLDDKKLPLRFYSRERIMSWEARIGWLEPDLLDLEAVDFV